MGLASAPRYPEEDMSRSLEVRRMTDHALWEKLEDELSGIDYWLIQGEVGRAKLSRKLVAECAAELRLRFGVRGLFPEA
jgi:hypothetical protein